jgi:hypothetical protein
MVWAGLMRVALNGIGFFFLGGASGFREQVSRESERAIACMLLASLKPRRDSNRGA